LEGDSSDVEQVSSSVEGDSSDVEQVSSSVEDDFSSVEDAIDGVEHACSSVEDASSGLEPACSSVEDAIHSVEDALSRRPFDSHFNRLRAHPEQSERDMHFVRRIWTPSHPSLLAGESESNLRQKGR
jgi:hypothetical protein